jgi:hypothetical protein
MWSKGLIKINKERFLLSFLYSWDLNKRLLNTRCFYGGGQLVISCHLNPNYLCALLETVYDNPKLDRESWYSANFDFDDLGPRDPVFRFPL